MRVPARPGFPRRNCARRRKRSASNSGSRCDRLEAVAKAKGWRLPEGNPVRTGTVPVTGEARTSANFIVSQITYHENVVATFRAQLGGKGDPQLKRELRAALPGYQKNLQMLLGLKL